MLDTPRQALAQNPYDSTAVEAATQLVVATNTHNGHVADHADEAIAALYTDHAGAILNAGEGSNAWDRSTPFAEALADNRDLAGSAHNVIAAALGADGTGPDGFSWAEYVLAATDAYRQTVAASGPKGESGDSAEVWGTELGEIDTELVQGSGRRQIIDGEIEDIANGDIRKPLDLLTDAAGTIANKTPYKTVSWGLKGLNIVEDRGLDMIYPLNNKQTADLELTDALRQQIAATQYGTLDAAIRSGVATDVPPELLADPNDPSKGLRVPTDDADAQQLQADAQAYLESLPEGHPVLRAIDAASSEVATAANDSLIDD